MEATTIVATVSWWRSISAKYLALVLGMTVAVSLFWYLQAMNELRKSIDQQKLDMDTLAGLVDAERKPETQRTIQDCIRKQEDRLAEFKANSLLLVAVIAGGVLLLTFAVTLLIVGPLKQLHRIVTQVDREWDLRLRVDVHGRDEVGQVGKAFNQMMDRISDLVLRLQEASLQVGTSSGDLLATSEQMSRGAATQAKHIEDATTAVTELHTSIQHVAGNARTAATTARKGGESVNRVVENMGRIRQTVEETSEKIKELGESSKEIGKIVGVITQISDQTSLLALNAAIEAARAGEHGKGFAVVADEVSKLADRVSRSAKEIEELIGRIRERTGESVTSMKAGTHAVEAGAQLVNDTGRNFLEIVDLVQETAHSVEEQSKVSDEINSIMAEILTIAKETVKATEEAVSQGNNLRELALRLETRAKQFKVATTADAKAGSNEGAKS